MVGVVEWAMLVPDCIVLFRFLVEKKPSDMCFHIDILTHSTWSHISGVIKIGYLTSEQAQKSIAKPKPRLNLKRSCGRIKTQTLT